MICFYLSESLEFVTSQAIIHYIVLEKTLKMLFRRLKSDLVGVMEWFKINSLKANLRKWLWFLEIKMKDLSY